MRGDEIEQVFFCFEMFFRVNHNVETIPMVDDRHIIYSLDKWCETVYKSGHQDWSIKTLEWNLELCSQISRDIKFFLPSPGWNNSQSHKSQLEWPWKVVFNLKRDIKINCIIQRYYVYYYVALEDDLKIYNSLDEWYGKA